MLVVIPRVTTRKTTKKIYSERCIAGVYHHPIQRQPQRSSFKTPRVNELKSIYISLLWLRKSFSLEQNQPKLKQELLEIQQKHLICLSDVEGHNVDNNSTNTVKKKNLVIKPYQSVAILSLFMLQSKPL